jgi:hemerythrin-like domain-containing protein
MSPIQTLLDEHRVIEQVLACLAQMAQRAEREQRLEAEPAREAVEFFRQFADRCHHGKEEQKLFPMMEARGFSPAEGPTAVMREEHVQGRALLSAIADAIDAAAAGGVTGVAEFARASAEYAQFLQAHIDKEDQVLFPMAERVLGPSGLGDLAASFDHVERQEIGAGVHEAWLARANALADRFGVRRAEPHRAPCGCSGHA